MHTHVEHQITQLTNFSIHQLREEWSRYFDCPAPKYNRINLERRLAYRMQEVMLGGLDKETLKRLHKWRNKKTSSKTAQKYKRLKPGSIITKTYNKIEHRVTVTEKGYDYDGRSYSNLSVIARMITGTRWSGPAFFGIEREDS